MTNKETESDHMERRREPTRFTERLSTFMVFVAAGGAAWVLMDPRSDTPFFGFVLGGEGFSADLKGAVITAILIGGWTAVKEYWLGASDSSRNQVASISRIAEGAAPATAAATAASAATTAAAAATAASAATAAAVIAKGGETISTGTVNVDAETVNVDAGKKS